MAEGGSEFCDSVKDSDYFYDFTCFPCEKDGRNVEAVKYCVDCDENLCLTCLTHHNRFATTRGHKVLDQVQTSRGQTKHLPSQRCNKHGGKIIDVFCAGHDIVGCSTCISVDHSSCKDKQFIPDVAAGIKTSKELKQLETEMKSLKKKLDSLKKLTGENLQRLRRDKDALKKEIQSVRKKMNEQLDKMEKDLVEEADTKFKQKIDALHAHVAEVDAALVRVKHAMDQVKSDNSDTDVFVTCKIVKQEISDEIYPLHARVEGQLAEPSLQLKTDDSIKLIMEGKTLFASIKEKYTIQGTEYKENINISLIDDKSTYIVCFMCALPDGCLVLADHNNKKLKKLDPVSHNVSTLIKLPDNPLGLCLVDNTCLAVTLFNQKKIQFVSLSRKVTLDSSFSVGDRCRSVAHCDGLLYVCCGGDTGNKEGRGHVEVYNCNGELLRCLYEEFDCPLYISVIKDGYHTTMYTADYYKGVQIRGVDGSVKHRYPTVLNTSLPFCLIGTDQVCIGERSTGNIYIQTYTDKRILLENKDVKGEPLCLYFDKGTSR